MPGVVMIELSAVIVAMDKEVPRVLLVRADVSGNAGGDGQEGLPCGPFDPSGHRTLDEGLRRWVDQQTGLPLGYVEQLYTFGDRFRDPLERAGGPRPVSVGYLALVRKTEGKSLGEGVWNDWYRSFPWEDWRAGPPEIIDAVIAPGLAQWCERAASRPERQLRRERADLTFAFGDSSWDNERVLERYELLYEAGLVAETARDGATLSGDPRDQRPLPTGVPLIKDHRRILATAMGRLRAKIKYRPVIFELMPPSFTLLQLQRAVEALAGGRLHKQNFRRLVAHEGLVERTGQISAQTGGRPAELFRFSRGVVLKRPAPGVRLPVRVKPRRKSSRK
ncbi:MAG: hypothetical protein EPO08_11595 [Rhodospirillaceae bacterium]|nr:MAG: hypothetical protein EPO08_11595 [Rhodospirillaceae bacterium]